MHQQMMANKFDDKRRRPKDKQMIWKTGKKRESITTDGTEIKKNI